MAITRRHDFLAALKRDVAGRWNLTSTKTGSADFQREKLEGTLRYFGKLDLLSTLEQQLAATPVETKLSEAIDALAEQLKLDLVEYLPQGLIEKYAVTEVAFLPLPNAAGYCLASDHHGTPLDGYIVGLNEGLWVYAQLLGKAFVLENFQGDYAAHAASGKPFFDRAVVHFLNPRGDHAASIQFDELPASIAGEASAAQSSMAILMLQFIALHEVGHIAHDDFKVMQTYSMHIANANLPGAIEPTLRDAAMHWEAEYRADTFALDAICGHAKTDINRWANFIVIWILFESLAKVEHILQKPICPLHPSPIHRLQRLIDRMQECYPPSTEVIEHLKRTESIVQSWDRVA
jgi:hypothetical protein